MTGDRFSLASVIRGPIFRNVTPAAAMPLPLIPVSGGQSPVAGASCQFGGLLMNRITQQSPLSHPISARGASLASLIRTRQPVCGSRHTISVDDAVFNQTLEAKLVAFRNSAPLRVARLTARQHQVLDLILAGYPSKNIAFDLRISQRTVENHRAAIAKATGAKSLPTLVHTAVCARCSLNNQSNGRNEAASAKVDSVPRT
jgi:DNA-binding CsgD family transcriptional regulator